MLFPTNEQNYQFISIREKLTLLTSCLLTLSIGILITLEQFNKGF